MQTDKPTLLILEDDELFRKALIMALDDKYHLLTAANCDEAQLLAQSNAVDCALIDIDLKSDKTGVDFLKFFQANFPDKPAIMQSGWDDSETIVKCIKLGASDYIQKPVEPRQLLLRVNKAMQDKKNKRVFERVYEVSQTQQKIVGQSEGIVRAKRLIEEGGNMRILLHGETGVGKTPFARYSNTVVNNLEGQTRPFEQINCSALNKEQFADVLFGHKKGAFTGALTDKRGLVEIADGGDLFLDEIGDMPLEVQTMFLTFLDSMEYYRLGDDKKRKANVRVISATNCDLPKMVQEGKFRKDLYSRISQVIVDIPPLRERGDDLTLLLEHFIETFAGYAKPYSPELLEVLKRHQWDDGNVREYMDAIQFICLRGRADDKLGTEHLSERYRPFREDKAAPTPAFIAQTADITKELEQHGLEGYLALVEKRALEKYLTEQKGPLDGLAIRLKTSRATLYRRLERYGLPVKR